MITVNDILQYIETIAPKAMQYEWDNTGLLCGRKTKQVKKILVALDPFEVVCKEAVEVGADMILTHHPLIFDAPRALQDNNDMGRAIFTLIENGIAAVNAHTNLDCAPGGVNDTLAEILGLENISVINPKGTDPEPWGLLRQGFVAEQALENFLATVKSALGCKGLRYVDGGKPVHRVAVGGGSCGSDMEEAIEAGCDTFVTADVKYNRFRDAVSAGINLIDAGHFHTENPVCKVLAAKVQEKFPEIQVVLSKALDDPTKFF